MLVFTKISAIENDSLTHSSEMPLTPFAFKLSSVKLPLHLSEAFTV